jgi:hypothetical protein
MTESGSTLHPADVFARQILILIGAVWLLIGAASLFMPNGVADFMNIRLDDALARFDFRAVYGGLQLGIGVFLVGAALRKPWRLPALNMANLVLGGLILGRVVSLAIDEPPGIIGFVLLGLEVALLAVAVFALLRLHRARAEERAVVRADEQSAAP